MLNVVVVPVKNVPVFTLFDTLEHNTVALSPFCGRITQNPGNWKINLHCSLFRSGISISFLSMRR